MPITVYHYPKCSTCRKALAWLEAHGVAHTTHDLVATPPSAATLRKLWKTSGLPIEKLFNTSGQSYRAPGMKERLAKMSDDEKLAALAADGKLVKRPIVAGEGFVIVGLDPKAYEARLGA